MNPQARREVIAQILEYAALLNWVRLTLPPPGRLTAYRSQGVVGVFVTLAGERAAGRFEALQTEKATIDEPVDCHALTGPVQRIL